MKIINALYQKVKILAFSRTARFTYVVFSGNLSSAVLAFIFTVLLIRNLSLADFGYFSAIWSLLLLVSDIADLGIGTSLSTFLPRMEVDKIKLYSFLKTSALFQSIVAFLVGITIFIFSESLSNLLFHTSDLFFLLRVTSLSIIISILGNFFVYSLSARQRFISVGFISVFGSFIRLILLLSLIFFSSVNLTNSILIQMITLVAVFIISFFLLGWEFIYSNVSKINFQQLISFTYLLGIAKGTTAIASRLDVLMIVAVKGPVEAGIYATASRVVSLYPLLSGSFSTVIAPRFASLTGKKELREFMIKVSLATVGIIATAVLLIFIAHPFMTILFKEKGQLASSVFQVLLISIILFIASVPAVSIAVYYLKKPQILTVNSVIQLIIVVLGNYLMIPRFGRFGAAYSLIAAYGVTLLTTTALTYYYYQKSQR